MLRTLRSVPRVNAKFVALYFNSAQENIRLSSTSTDETKQKRKRVEQTIVPTISLLFVGGVYLGWRKYHSTILSHSEVLKSNYIKPVYSESKKTISTEELNKHRTVEDGGIWMSFRGKVYDVTEFVDKHPGGDKILLAAGGDVTPFWSIYAFHYDDHVTEMLKEYYIGDLAEVPSTHDTTPKDGPYSNEPERHPALITVSSAPRNAETQPGLIPDHPITPSELFFVRNHLPVPDIKTKEYKLEIQAPALSKRQSNLKISLNLDDLKKNFKQHKIISTMICAGNRRADMMQEDSEAAKAENRKPIIRGLPWKHSALSTAEWTGVLLRDVLVKYLLPKRSPQDHTHLLEAARSAGIRHVQFIGADSDVSSGSFGSSLPIEWALDPNKEVLLAYEINGTPLNRDQGYPLRVIVPGSIGARQVKWLTQIVLSKEESSSYWFTDDYKLVFPNPSGEQPDQKKLPAIMDPPVQSAICEPVDGHTIRNTGSVTVSGYAFSGGGRGILSVRVSTDSGKTWYEAELQPVSPPCDIDPSTVPDGDLALEHRTSRQWAWTLWRAEIPIPDDATELELVCCARDSSNATQPENCKALLNTRGLLMNAWHRIRVKVVPDDL